MLRRGGAPSQQVDQDRYSPRGGLVSFRLEVVVGALEFYQASSSNYGIPSYFSISVAETGNAID